MAPRKQFTILKEELIDLYYNQWVSPKEISEQIGCSRDLIYHYIDKFDIPKRPMVKNIIGETRGFLKILSFDRIGPQGAYWKCQCICGNIIIKCTSALSADNISCGCKNKKANFIHGMVNSRQYSIWQGMKSRCTNKNTINYKNYGGRGITYCKQWEKFINFWEDMKIGYSDNLTLDRINTNENYCKENCRWATIEEQNLNKRTNHFVTFRNNTKTVTEWAECFNVDRNRLFYYLKNNNDDLQKALEKAKINNPMEKILW